MIDAFLRDIRTREITGADFGDGLAAQRVFASIRSSFDESEWTDV